MRGGLGVIDGGRTSAPPPEAPAGAAPAGDGQQQEQAEDVPGRQDGGQEQAVDVAVVRDSLHKLLKLAAKAEGAKEALSDAIKTVAKDAGLQAAVLKRFVKARAAEDFAPARRNAAQLELLFSEIGEE